MGTERKTGPPTGEAQERWREEFSGIGDEFDRYTWLMALGEGLRGIPEKERTQDLLFSGCMSRVWMRLEEKDGRLSLRTDSDTLILRGILFLLEDLLDERTCAEVGSAKIDLFREMDLESVFNGTRKKGMGSLVSEIQKFARERGDDFGKEKRDGNNAVKAGRNLQGD